MNIESSASATITKTNDTTTSSSAPNSSSATDNSSFKEQLSAVKTQEQKTAQDTTKTENETIKENAQDITAQNTQNAQKNAAENTVQQITKDKLSNIDNKEKSDENKISDPFSELNSQIAILNGLKNEFTKTQGIGAKSTDKTESKDDYCATMKMDNKDITFFVNLVDNQQMIAQSGQVNNQSNNSVTNNFTEIKNMVTQSTVQVSQTLIDALNKSAETGKPFRIDFGNDVAVIMKVDKQGTLSANFIPGSAAVEAYLKNNIEGLRQSFDNQGLAYNELTYSNQQKQQQKQKQQKENENE